MLINFTKNPLLHYLEHVGKNTTKELKPSHTVVQFRLDHTRMKGIGMNWDPLLTIFPISCLTEDHLHEFSHHVGVELGVVSPKFSKFIHRFLIMELQGKIINNLT